MPPFHSSMKCRLHAYTTCVVLDCHRIACYVPHDESMPVAGQHCRRTGSAACRHALITAGSKHSCQIQSSRNLSCAGGVCFRDARHPCWKGGHGETMIQHHSFPFPRTVQMIVYTEQCRHPALLCHQLYIQIFFRRISWAGFMQAAWRGLICLKLGPVMTNLQFIATDAPLLGPCLQCSDNAGPFPALL